MKKERKHALCQESYQEKNDNGHEKMKANFLVFFDKFSPLKSM